ncbi:MAG: hypothetical protein JF590_00650 [Gemmatimonadetes bacterium]|nr:hypothetical protein [Gemmatimonadota bacterium]
MRRLLLTAAALVALTSWSPPVLAAQVHLKRGVTLRKLEQAVAKDPYDPAALYDLALGYWSKKRWDDVERTLRTTLSVEPRNALALLAEAYLPYARRPQLWEEEDSAPSEWQPALQRSDRLTRRAFLIDPLVDLQIVGAVAPDANTLLHGGTDASPDRTALVGLAYFRNAQYAEAFAWFDRLARALGGETDPTRVPGFVLYYRGLAAAHLNDMPAAIRDFRRLRTMADSPGGADDVVDPAFATYVLAYLLQQSGAYDEAKATYQVALAEDLGNWMAHVQLAKIASAPWRYRPTPRTRAWSSTSGSRSTRRDAPPTPSRSWPRRGPGCHAITVCPTSKGSWRSNSATPRRRARRSRPS